MHCFAYERRIRRHETDATQLLQSANYFRLMEECECAFLRSLDLTFFIPEDDLIFPRVNVSCNVLHPLRSGDLVTIELIIKRLGVSSMTFSYLFLNRQEVHVADGEISIVSCVHNSDTEQLKPVPLRREMKERLSHYSMKEDVKC